MRIRDGVEYLSKTEHNKRHNFGTTVSAEELKRLQERDNFLSCLEVAGVEFWEGFEFALDIYKEEFGGTNN